MRRDMKTIQAELDNRKIMNNDRYQALLGLKDSEACDILMSIHKIVFGEEALSPRLRHWEMRDLPKLIHEKYMIKPL
jgi:hypothetical protein